MACSSNDCLKSAGDVTTERRELPAFRYITATENVNVTLVQDTETYAEVRTGSHLQADLKAEVRGDHLYISNESTCNWARSYSVPHEVVLHLPTFQDLSLYGQGNIRTEGQFQVDSLILHLKGAGDFDLNLNSKRILLDQYELGDINLQGQTNELLLSGGGLGRFFAANLRIKDQCFLNLSSYADGAVYVNTSGLLTGYHAGTSTVHYTGSPSGVEVQVTGKGKLVPGN
ncbi:DUF2807 domain-containing protein [Hymenobacter tibetensis]|uniref:DUF2807 domain-containing protein n=1 Tax=Hymenobacter tibetensis TaxID=497967 RepID=A0ABY4D318_9BACT|nr:DUF2807 domain-containing protein [Hymenobacter tibetensis]UOG76696.1 DUF2807 domain-containing protein [Hymenobacter tibetensis]